MRAFLFGIILIFTLIALGLLQGCQRFVSAASIEEIPVFADVSQITGIVDNRVAGIEMATGQAWGDYDNDGFLDLYIANWSCYPKCGRSMDGESDQLYRNNGDGAFTNVTDYLKGGTTGAGFVAGFTDFDNDGDIENSNEKTQTPLSYYPPCPACGVWNPHTYRNS